MLCRSFVKRVTVAALTGFSALALGTSAYAQSALFSPISSMADSGARSDLVASISSKSTTRSLDLVRIDLGALQSDSVAMSLRDGNAVANKQRTMVRSADNYTWVGTFPGGGDAVLVVMDGEITGQIQKGLNGYRVQPVGNGVHAIVGIDPGKFPADHPVLKTPIRLNTEDTVKPSDAPVTVTADGIQVDVLVAYTTTAKNAYGSSMPALAQLSVDVSNTAYTASNANISVRLVGTQEVNYSESGQTFDTMLSAVMSSSNSEMVAVRTKRDAVGADLVGLLINLSDACGLASSISATAANAYMTAYWDCAVDNNSYAHENGHLFGARHDPYVDPTTTPYAYGHGYITPSNAWRTIMAYVNGCGSCPRLRFFSNPSLSYGGLPTGTVATNDNARVHRERVATVAAFRATVTTPTTTTKAHDFNGDAKSDIMWRNTSGEAGMWLMNGGAIASSPSLGVIANSWSIVGQRDFNGDGKADLLWRNSSGEAGIWFMNGGTTLALGGLGNPGSNWSVVGTGDFNGDGKGDILWRSTAGDFGIWFMNGGTVVSTFSLGNFGSVWNVAGTGDFNGDGKTDILWRSSTNDIGLWLMNGTTVIATPSLGNVGPSWSVQGTGDFNGDGKYDILWRNTSGEAGMWLMNGGTITSNPSLGNPGLNWAVQSVGDYDGDGKSDILWRSTSNDIGIWFMNGSAIASLASFGVFPSAWQVQNAASN